MPGHALAVVAAALALAACTPVAAAETAGSTVTVKLRAAAASMPVAAERRAGYDRDLFPHWVDADGDGCNTRNEVLVAEATVAPRAGARCRLTGGRWLSYYDRRTWADRSRIDVDHMVPLAEAWDSGARSWTTARRRAFANDLGDPRSLVGVTDTVNQAKSDQDVAEWLPRYDRCRYLREFVAVKIRWRLTVDGAEKAAMRRLVAGCADVVITVKRV